MSYVDRVLGWLKDSSTSKRENVRRVYCLREKRVTEHEYKRVDIDGLEWYDEYTCLICGMTMGYGKKRLVE